jgi:hypothetical protein
VCKRNGRLNSVQGEIAERLINLTIYITLESKNAGNEHKSRQNLYNFFAMPEVLPLIRGFSWNGSNPLEHPLTINSFTKKGQFHYLQVTNQINISKASTMACLDEVCLDAFHSSFGLIYDCGLVN